MGVIYVAKSTGFSKWASDVGLSKHVYKVGVTDEDPKTVAAAGWAGETDWSVMKKEDVAGLLEEEAIERLARKTRMIDPNLYPRLKGVRGFFKVTPQTVESSTLVARAMSGEGSLREVKLKPADFAAWLIQNAKS
jgi:hypothetical protein